jgi:hypothetical protein
MAAILAARVLCGQAAIIQAANQRDAYVLLERARAKILDSIRRLPNYICLETVDRAYYVTRQARLNSRAMTESPSYFCDGKPAGYLSMDAKDRLRVEVAIAGEDEIHSWPGASSFDTRRLDQMIPFGPTSTGSFGTFLLDMFENRIAEVSFKERKGEGSQTVFEYSYRVPKKPSRYRVKAGNRWEITGYSGSFQINAQTAELARLVIDTDQLSRATGMCAATTTLDYSFTTIGDGEFLIPRQSELRTFDTNSNQTDSVTGFSGCHEFTAESNLRFDGSDTAAGVSKPGPVRAAALPSGISLTLALLSSIDSSKAAAGDAISATVVTAVRRPRSNQVLVPAGAIAHGRILRMRQDLSSQKIQISIRFDTVETQGSVSPVSLRLNRDRKAESRTSSGLKTRAAEFSLPPPLSKELGSSFEFPARNGVYVVPAGFQSKWTTVAQ